MRHSTLAVLLVTCCLLCSCRNSVERPRPGKGENITLTVWVNYNNEEIEFMEKATAEWEAAWNSSHGRKVAVILAPVPFGGLLPKIKTACQTHTTPDICRVDCAHVVPLAYGRSLVALDSLESFQKSYDSIAMLRNQYVKAAIDSNIIRVKREGKWVEHLFGLPDQTTCVALFRNRSIFRECSARLRAKGLDPERAPKTWRELVDYGKVLSVPSKSQYAFAMDNSLWWTLPFFNCFGADFIRVDEKGRYTCVLNSDYGVEALGFKVDLYQKRYDSVRIEAGAWIPGAVSKDMGFINQNYAMILSGPWNIETFRRAGVDFAVSQVPEGPSGSSSNVGGTNLVIFKSCPFPDIAYQYISWITGPDVQARWGRELGQIPTAISAFSRVDTSDRPELAVFFEQILTARARPRVPNYDVLEEIINPEMELALKAVKTPRQCLDDAVRRINAEVLSELNE